MDNICEQALSCNIYDFIKLVYNDRKILFHRYGKDENKVTLLIDFIRADNIESSIKFYISMGILDGFVCPEKSIVIDDALIEAAKHVEEKTVTLLLNAGGNPYAENKFGKTAFRLAAANDHVNLMKSMDLYNTLPENEAAKALATTLERRSSAAFNYLMSSAYPVKIDTKDLPTAFILALEGDNLVSLNKLLTLWQEEKDPAKKIEVAAAELEAIRYAIFNRKLSLLEYFPLERYDIVFSEPSDYVSNPRYLIYLAVEHGCAGLIEKMEQLYLETIWSRQLVTKAGGLLQGFVDGKIVPNIPVFGHFIGKISGSILSKNNLDNVGAMVPFSGYRSIIVRNRQIDRALNKLYEKIDIPFEDMENAILAVYDISAKSWEEAHIHRDAALKKIKGLKDATDTQRSLYLTPSIDTIQYMSSYRDDESTTVGSSSQDTNYATHYEQHTYLPSLHGPE